MRQENVKGKGVTKIDLHQTINVGKVWFYYISGPLLL